MSEDAENASTVFLLGDSITQGLGSKRINFVERLKELVAPLHVESLALTGTTINYPLELLAKGEMPLEGGCYVILYGNVDAQIRPNREGRVFSAIPMRFRGGGMLMPRPFYSRNPIKSVVQHAENFARKMISSLIIAVDGTEQWVDADSFAKHYGELLDSLAPSPCICCSTVHIDGMLFKGTPEQYGIFDDLIVEACSSRGAIHLDIGTPLRRAVEAAGWDSVYNKDHFHPNAGGYELMARLIANKVAVAMGEDSAA